MSQEPNITVSNLRLTGHRCKPNAVAACADLTITGKSGLVRSWPNVRLVFDEFWPVDIPIGSYSLFVEGETRGGYKRGTRLIPPCWRRAAREAVYDAACEMEQQWKREIRAGTRWAALPLEKISPKRREATW